MRLNRHELKAMRKLLFLSSAEAGKYIAGRNGEHPARAWQRWESGRYNIPDDVCANLLALIRQRNECLAGVVAAGEDEAWHKWYPDFKSFAADFPGSNEVVWKLHQSILAELISKCLNVELLTDIETVKSGYIYNFFTAKATRMIRNWFESNTEKR